MTINDSAIRTSNLSPFGPFGPDRTREGSRPPGWPRLFARLCSAAHAVQSRSAAHAVQSRSAALRVQSKGRRQGVRPGGQTRRRGARSYISWRLHESGGEFGDR